MALGDIVLLRNKTPVGPFTRRQIQEGLSRGDFSARELAHTPGLRDWLPLVEVLHHLDRETVHAPRSHEGRNLPPLPNAAAPASGESPTLGRGRPTSDAPIAPLPREIEKSTPPLLTSKPENEGIIEKKMVSPSLLEPDNAVAKAVGPPTLPSSFELEPGPIGARVVASVIDCAVLFVPVLVVFALGYGAWAVRGPLEHRDPETARQEQELLWRNLRDLVTIVAIGFAWFYAAGLESSRWQGTVGKQIMGLIVTDGQGRRLGFLQATGRHAAKYLSALPVFLGFMAALFNPQRLTWHDRLAGTRVVKR